jgi:hypothetical protein
VYRRLCWARGGFTIPNIKLINSNDPDPKLDPHPKLDPDPDL